jgi:hypothetical protein
VGSAFFGDSIGTQVLINASSHEKARGAPRNNLIRVAPNFTNVAVLLRKKKGFGYLQFGPRPYRHQYAMYDCAHTEIE